MFFMFLSVQKFERSILLSTLTMIEMKEIVNAKTVLRRLRKPKYFAYLLLLCGILISLVRWTHSDIIFYPPLPTEIREPHVDSYLTKYSSNYWQPEAVKTILLWTPVFSYKPWPSLANNNLKSCDNLRGRCEVTDNKSHLIHASAVIFHANDFWKMWLLSASPKASRPSYRHPRQVWIMMTQEPTVNMWGWFPKNMFNWTMTYRRDSTIVMHYGSYIKKPDEELPISPQEIDYFRGKTKMAVIQVSHCDDNARRYKIVRELSRYIDVDEFGECSGRVICPRDAKLGKPLVDCENFFKDYKFYLAFENSVCRDYITEKYWDSQVNKHQIPVVAASKATLELLPPHSYINVFDFPSVKDMANEMIRIATNASLYNSYFKWHHYYKPGPNPFCSLCNALHDNRTAQTYHDLGRWIKHDTCTTPTVGTPDFPCHHT